MLTNITVGDIVVFITHKKPKTLFEVISIYGVNAKKPPNRARVRNLSSGHESSYYLVDLRVASDEERACNSRIDTVETLACDAQIEARKLFEAFFRTLPSYSDLRSQHGDYLFNADVVGQQYVYRVSAVRTAYEVWLKLDSSRSPIAAGGVDG